MKRRKQILAHTVHQVAAVDQVLLAEREQVAAVGPLGSRRQPEEELRTEVGDQLAVGRSRGVVELVDDDVVERLGREPLQVLASAQRLDGCEDDFGVGILDLAGVVAEVRFWADSSERVERLVEDLLSMRDEEHASKLRPTRIEGGQPRLAEAGRQHDETGLVALRVVVFSRAASAAIWISCGSTGGFGSSR